MTHSTTIAALMEAVQRAENQMYKNLNECMFADDRPMRILTLREKIIGFFKEAKNRISNAYACLVKGVDPYDYY